LGRSDGGQWWVRRRGNKTKLYSRTMSSPPCAHSPHHQIIETRASGNMTPHLQLLPADNPLPRPLCQILVAPSIVYSVWIFFLVSPAQSI
jgi:hypothetical protein